MAFTLSDSAFWLVTVTGLASLTATLVLLARWPRMRLRQR